MVFTQGFRCKNFHERKEYDAQKEGEKTIPFPRFGAFSRYFTPEVPLHYPPTTAGSASVWAEMAAKKPKSTLERSPNLVKIILDVCIFLTF